MSLHSAGLIAVLDDRILILFRCYGLVVQAADACLFAQGGTYAGRELRERIREHKALKCFVPEALVYEVVPVGTKVV